MKKYYQILGLEEGATEEEVEEKYNELLKEFNPEKQSDDDLKEFFKSEQDKVKEAYLEISLSLKAHDEEIVSKEIDMLDIDDSNNIQICYQTLKLSEDATLAEINTKYNLLLDEFNPDHQSDDLRYFFELEQEKVKEAYNAIVKHLSEEEASEEQVEKYLNEGVVDSEVHDLGDYHGNDETKFCKFCGHMQYVTNPECINCLESLHNSFSKPSGSLKSTTESDVNNEPLDGGVKLLSFCFPIVGIILYFVHSNSAPQKSKDACSMALWSIGIGIVLNILVAIGNGM